MSGPRRRPASSRQGRRRPTANAGAFWGAEPDAPQPPSAAIDDPEGRDSGGRDPDDSGATTAAQPAARIVPTRDATAMIRSLGPAPLPGRETVAEHYFAAVYERAAAVATALAAASGLLDTETDADPEPTA